MCGICGFVKFSQDRLSTNDFEILEKMGASLIHRGPDAKNSQLLDNIALGFTRLSIIGIDNGMQPICNEDDSIVLVCNGEIFNYLELRSELIIKGHVFKTETDVEVILHLYEEYGIKFLNKLNGQFAFVLYDRRRKLVFCVRDQLGIIPLYYTCTQDTFIFGSEIKAILQHPLVKAEVDKVGLDQVITFPGLISPRTMFEKINSLENGHYLEIDRNGNIKKSGVLGFTYREISW